MRGPEPSSLTCKRTLRVQLPEGDSTLQMLENPLSLLKSIRASWLCFIPTIWVMDMILAVAGGVAIYLLLCPFLPKDDLWVPPPPPPPPPPLGRKKILRKYHVVKKCWKFRKKSCTRKARRDCREEGKGTDDLASSLQSHLGNDLHGGRLHQPLREDAPDEKFQSVCARADRPRRQPLEDSFVTASSSLVSHAPSTEHVPPVASTLSPGLKTFPVSLGSQPALSAYHPPEPPIPPRCLSPQPLLLSPPPSYSPSPMASRPPLPDPSLALPQRDSSPLPLGAIPQNLCPPNNCWLSSPEPETSILGDTGCPISALSQCQEPPGALCHSNLSNSECQGGHLTPQSPEASVLPETAYTQVQVGSSYFLNPDVQKVLDTLIKKKVEQICKNTEEEGQNVPLYSLGNMLSSLGKEQDPISPQAFWKTRCKAEQLSVSQELFYPKVLWDHLQQKCSQLFWGLPTLHSESLMDNIRASGASLEVSPIVFNGLHNSIPVQIQANAPLQLLSSQPLVHYVAQSQTLTPTMPSSQTPPQKQTQVHVPSLPIVPCSSPPVRAWEVSCPTKKKGKKYSISPTIQHLQDKLLKEERENRRVLPPVAKKSQQVVSQSTDKHWASQENINFPVNIIQSKLREQLEQHFQKNHMCELPQKTHLSLGLTGLREKYPETRQAKENSGPSQTSEVSDKSSQVIQKFRSGHPEISQEGKYSSNDLGQVLKGLSEIPKNSPVNDLESMSEGGSETNMLRPSRSDSGYDSARGPDKKHLEDSVFMETEQKSSDWAVTKGASVMSTSQNLNVSLKSLKSLRSNKSLPSSKISTFQDPGDSCLGTQAKSKNQNQTEDSATGVLLLDFATGKVPQGSASEFLLTEDILASQTSLLRTQGVSASSMSPSGGICDPLARNRMVQEQKEPRISKPRDPPKSKSNMFGPLESGEGFGSPRRMIANSPSSSRGICDLLGRERMRQEQKELRMPKPQDPRMSKNKMFGSAERKKSFERPKAGGKKVRSEEGRGVAELIPPSQLREVGDTKGSKSPLLSEKKQASSESTIGHRGRNFLRYIYPDKSRGEAEPLQKVKPPSTTTQSQVSVTSSRLSMDSGSGEAQVFMTPTGRIGEETMRLQHKLYGSQESVPKGKSQTEKRSFYHRNACGQRASPKGPAFPPREPELLTSLFHLRPVGTGTSDHLVHCPRHCALQKRVSPSQSQNTACIYPRSSY